MTHVRASALDHRIHHTRSVAILAQVATSVRTLRLKQRDFGWRVARVFLLSLELEDVAFVVFLVLVAARCLGFAPSAEPATMLDDGSAPTESVVTLVVERRRGSPCGTITGSARTVATATTGAERYAGSPRRSKVMVTEVKAPRSISRVETGAAGVAPMKIMDHRESLQMALLEIEQVMQALRAVNNDPAVAQLLALKQCEAEQTRATRPLRTQLKAAIESRDKLMKKHSVVVEGVQSLTAQLQARQSESEELAIALRDKAQLVVQLQERVRVEELAEVPYVPLGHTPGGMSAAQWAEGLTTALPGSQAASIRDWMGGCQVAATRTTAREISDSEDDELWRRMNQAANGLWSGVRLWCFDRAAVSQWQCTVLRAVSWKSGRCEREGEGCRGQRRAAHEGVWSVSDAAFSLCSRKGRARLVDVPKTKKAGWGGDQTKRRSVGLQTSASKIFSRIVRRRTVPQLVESCRSSQMGGTPWRSAETGSHVVRQFAEGQRERKASYAMVFEDAVAACDPPESSAVPCTTTSPCTLTQNPHVSRVETPQHCRRARNPGPRSEEKDGPQQRVCQPQFVRSDSFANARYATIIALTLAVPPSCCQWLCGSCPNACTISRSLPRHRQL